MHLSTPSFHFLFRSRPPTSSHSSPASSSQRREQEGIGGRRACSHSRGLTLCEWFGWLEGSIWLASGSICPSGERGAHLRPAGRTSRLDEQGGGQNEFKQLLMRGGQLIAIPNKSDKKDPRKTDQISVQLRLNSRGHLTVPRKQMVHSQHCAPACCGSLGSPEL